MEFRPNVTGISPSFKVALSVAQIVSGSSAATVGGVGRGVQRVK